MKNPNLTFLLVLMLSLEAQTAEKQQLLGLYVGLFGTDRRAILSAPIGEEPLMSSLKPKRVSFVGLKIKRISMNLNYKGERILYLKRLVHPFRKKLQTFLTLMKSI